MEIFKDMPFNKYVEHEGINASLVKKLVTNGAMSLFAQSQKSKALDIGTSIHALILEGYRDFVVSPYDRRTKDGREFVKNNTNKKIYTQAENDMIEAVRDSVELNFNASSWLKGIVPEISVFDSWDGIPVKARLDGIKYDKDNKIEYLLDLKTTSNFANFENDFFKFGYDIQSQFYRKILKAEYAPFIFIAAETVSPYRVKVFIDSADISEDLVKIVKIVDKILRKPKSRVYEEAHRSPAQISSIPSFLQAQRQKNQNDYEQLLSLL